MLANFKKKNVAVFSELNNELFFISETEAMFLYQQGTLQQKDILGTQQYQIADGSISEGTIINLRTVKIGNKTLKNVGSTPNCAGFVTLKKVSHTVNGRTKMLKL